MATDTRGVDATLPASDAAWRTWCTAVHNQLVAVGLVVTADTGQIDLTTAVRSGSANTASGFKMYRFADALQASKPVFIKVEFGVGNPATQSSLWVTIGTSTNGAGTLNGTTLTTRKQLQLSHTANILQSYASGDGSRFILWHNHTPGGGNTALFFGVERLKDGNGQDVDGVIIYASASSGGIGSGMIQAIMHGLAATGTAAFMPSLPVYALPGWQTLGADVAIAPMMIPAGRWRYILPVTYRNSDLAELVPFTMDHLGATRTFLPMAAGHNAMYPSAHAGAINMPSGNTAYAIPWE